MNTQADCLRCSRQSMHRGSHNLALSDNTPSTAAMTGHGCCSSALYAACIARIPWPRRSRCRAGQVVPLPLVLSSNRDCRCSRSRPAVKVGPSAHRTTCGSTGKEVSTPGGWGCRNPCVIQLWHRQCNISRGRQAPARHGRLSAPPHTHRPHGVLRCQVLHRCIPITPHISIPAPGDHERDRA